MLFTLNFYLQKGALFNVLKDDVHVFTALFYLSWTAKTPTFQCGYYHRFISARSNHSFSYSKVLFKFIFQFRMCAVPIYLLMMCHLLSLHIKYLVLLLAETRTFMFESYPTVRPCIPNFQRRREREREREIFHISCYVAAPPAYVPFFHEVPRLSTKSSKRAQRIRSIRKCNA